MPRLIRRDAAILADGRLHRSDGDTLDALGRVARSRRISKVEPPGGRRRPPVARNVDAVLRHAPVPRSSAAGRETEARGPAASLRHAQRAERRRPGRGRPRRLPRGDVSRPSRPSALALCARRPARQSARPRLRGRAYQSFERGQGARSSSSRERSATSTPHGAPCRACASPFATTRRRGLFAGPLVPAHNSLSARLRSWPSIVAWPPPRGGAQRRGAFPAPRGYAVRRSK